MGRYGSKTTADGKDLQANGSMPKLTGERVVGNVIEYFGMAVDFHGNTSETVAEIRFKQSNGATFKHQFRDSELDWAIDNLNKAMLHICTKIVTEAEYYAIVDGATSFTSFIEAIRTKIMPKAAGMSFTLKITLRENTNENSDSYGRWFPQFPQFPNFIELDGTSPSTLTTNPKYDIYEVPTATDVEPTEEGVEQEEQEEIF